MKTSSKGVRFAVYYLLAIGSLAALSDAWGGPGLGKMVYAAAFPGMLLVDKMLEMPALASSWVGFTAICLFNAGLIRLLVDGIAPAIARGRKHDAAFLG